MASFPQRQGDKKNSSEFEAYLKLVYERKTQNGFQDNVQGIVACLMQCAPNEGMDYVAEMHLLTPYRLKSAYQNKSHTLYILSIDADYPDYYVLEPRAKGYKDAFTEISSTYPNSRTKPAVKYLGEIFQVNSIKEAHATLKEEGIRFISNHSNQVLANPNLLFTEISYYSNEIIGYTEKNLNDDTSIGFGQKIEIPGEMQMKLEEAATIRKNYGIDSLVLGIDHLNSRVLSNEREMALLEYVTKTNYYFWGAYNIEKIDSSTNVLRNPTIQDEIYSPAKVFTASNNPYLIQHMQEQISPTETFVRNYGKRSHHIAYQVIDGELKDGTKNIDHVVRSLYENNVPFLGKVYGQCEHIPDLKQIFSEASPFSFIVTEYVQRCHEFQGFFTKSNVADLTIAAGKSETLRVQ